MPEVLHRRLKARAAAAGMSLSDYLPGELREIAERPALAEFREHLHTRRPVAASLDTADLVSRERAGGRWLPVHGWIGTQGLKPKSFLRPLRHD